MNILVTGGSGYIGSHTVIELINNNYNPIIIDNFSNSQPWIINQISSIVGKKITYFDINCCDYKNLKKIFEKYKFSGVIHFAALKSLPESYIFPTKYYENNILSTINIINLIKIYNIPYFVFSSSCIVYGEDNVLPINENTNLKPSNSPYGYTKQICEKIISDTLNKNTFYVSLRYFNPIGAHKSGKIGELPIGEPSNLIPYITQTAIGLRKKLIVFGNDYDTPDGTCVRDYINIIDLAKAHVKSLELMQEKMNSYTFNIGTGNGLSVLEIIKKFENITGEKLNYIIGNRRSGDVEKIYACNKLAKKILKWEPENSISNALKTAWEWQKNITRKLL